MAKSGTIKRYNKIKVVLAQKGKTSKELAAYLGILESRLSNYVRNATQPSIEMLYTISDFLGCEAIDLLVLKSELETDDGK